VRKWPDPSEMQGTRTKGDFERRMGLLLEQINESVPLSAS